MHNVRVWVATVLTKFSINSSSSAPEGLKHVHNLQITTHVYDFVIERNTTGFVLLHKML